jgi:hypothetical protein
MSRWYDFGTVLPRGGELIRLRRFPEDTPPYFGVFDVAAGRAVSTVGSGWEWVTPWASLTHWSVLHGAPGAWPLAVVAAATWRDPFWSPPADGQHVWLRRFHRDTASLPASWVCAEQAYAVAGTTWLLPWHLVWKWKPR